MVKNWLDNWAYMVVANRSYSSWMAETSRVLQGSVQELVPFNISISGLEEGIKCSLVKFADDTKLGRISQHAKGLGCQRDLDRLKLKKDKCKGLGARNHLQ